MSAFFTRSQVKCSFSHAFHLPYPTAIGGNSIPTAIVIYQDGDESWMPYGSMLNDYVYVVSIDGLHGLMEELMKKSDSEISVMESRIEGLREDYFTYDGVLEQIRLFLTEPSRSALTCRPLPQTSGTTTAIRWPHGHQCIKSIS